MGRLTTHLGTDDDPDEIRWPVPMVQVAWEDATGDGAWNDMNEIRDLRAERSWRAIDVGYLLERQHGRRGYILMAGSIVPGSKGGLRPRFGNIRKIPSQWATVKTLGMMNQDGSLLVRGQAQPAGKGRKVRR